MTPFEIVVTTSSVNAALIGAVLWFARNLIQERLRGAIKHEYDTKLEKLKSDLQRESETGLTNLRNQLEKEAEQELARLQKELDILKTKELSGYQEKLKAYRLVIDVFAEVYSDLQIAFKVGQFGEVQDKYNRFWVRCYGYLSIMAPQEVMDAFDRLNDYLLMVLSGRQLPKPWQETRELALDFINCVRRDLKLIEGDIEYHGEL